MWLPRAGKSNKMDSMDNTLFFMLNYKVYVYVFTIEALP